MPTTLPINPEDATGLLEFSQLKICGWQINTADCETGEALTEPTNVLTGCGLNDFSWDAERDDDTDIKGKCASFFERGKILWYDYEFGFCEKRMVLLEDMLGQHDLMTATDGGNDVMGMMAPAKEQVSNLCCPEDETCEHTRTHMTIWGLNRCGPNAHPEYRFLIMYIPALEWDVSGSGQWQDDNFSEYTLDARAHCPVGPVGAGVGGIIPAHYAATKRPYYIVGTNSPPPTCGGCGQCNANEEIIAEGEGVQERELVNA